MKVRVRAAVVVCFVLVLAACTSTEGTDDAASGDATTVEPTTTVTTVTSTTTPTTTTPGTGDAAAVGDDLEILWDRDVVYLTDDEGEWTMDVFYPSEDGADPWPLVVVYHGMTTNAAISQARAIAAGGAVAVAPVWLKETAPTLSREAYVDGALFDRAACATAMSQELAGRYGADASNTTVAGFSAGVHPAGWVGLGVVRNDVCDAPMRHLPRGLSLGDSQLIFFEAGWDASFADSASQAADTTDRFVNPERWNLDPDVAVHLWTTGMRYGREVSEAPGPDSWIRGRDTTGDLVDDLVALDALNDEFVDWSDNGALLEKRLSEAGYSAVHESVGGPHQYSDVVYDGIDAIVHRDPVAPVNAQTGWVWPSTETLTALATSFCSDFPQVTGLLHDQVSLAAVSEEGWDPETSEVLRGKEVVGSVLDAQEVVALECGDLVIQADWVAIPYVLVEPFGPEFEGVFTLKSTDEGQATWVAWYRSLRKGGLPFEAIADGDRVAEAMETCEAIEGHRITRDADDYVALMTDDPAIHSIPNTYHALGEEGVRRTVALYPYSDDIACIDRTTGSGAWSVIGMTLDNRGAGIALEGPVVHQHTDDGIRAIYHHWTDAGMSPGLEASIWGTAPAP